MCFSPTASFTAGAGLLVVSAVTLSRVRSPAEIPYALIPGLFAIQQLIEGGLWLTFAGKAPHLNAVLTHAYAFFSHVFWPIFVPIAVFLIEPYRRRRRFLLGFAAAGAFAGLYLLYFLAADPTTAEVVDGHILYISPHFFAAPVLALYVLGTCASSFLSSHSEVRMFGFAAAVSLAAAYAFFALWFISVWCFFAAVLSVVVLLYFRPKARKPEHRATIA